MEDRPTAEVDRIRDIIFGPQMRLYEQQFQRLVGQTELLSKQVDELRAALEQQKADQESRLHKAQGSSANATLNWNAPSPSSWGS